MRKCIAAINGSVDINMQDLKAVRNANIDIAYNTMKNLLTSTEELAVNPATFSSSVLCLSTMHGLAVVLSNWDVEKTRDAELKEKRDDWGRKLGLVKQRFGRTTVCA